MVYITSQALELDPKNPQIHLNFAHLLIHVGELAPARQALRYFASALEQYRSVETGLAQTAVLASQNLYAAALENLQLAEEILKSQPNSTLRRSRAEYEQEIARIRRILEQDLAHSMNP